MRILILMAILAVGVGAAETRVAQPLPAFSLKDVNGQSLTSSNFTGKTLVIWFFASWDKPCRKQLPVLQELQNDYRTNGVVVIGVSLDSEEPLALKTFITANHVSFPIAMADMDFIQSAGGLEVVPTTLIVEPHSNIIGRYAGVTERAVLEADLKTILNQGRPR
ncbi:MAG: TlpA disulfide reductase family protein [Verrucomicrobiota bacterium]